MKPVEHRRFRFQLLLGATLTALVVAADSGGLLDFLENKLHDLRCRHCQAFLRKPLPPVHVDIDEAALQAIAPWPWPRATIAVVIDELYAAGAKVIALDILFQDAKPDEDDVLAQSLAAGGGTVLAVSLGSPSGELAASQSWQRLQVELLKNLELSPEDASRLTVGATARSASRAERFETEFLTARKEAMFRRVNAELESGSSDRQALRARLLPGMDPAATADELPLAKLYEDQFDLAMRARGMRPFFRERPAGAPPAFSQPNQSPPSLPLSQATAGCGFTNYSSDADGIVRAVVLLLDVDGRLLPQLGLTAVCVAVGAKPQDIHITPAAITIPRAPPASDIVIPVHVHDFGHGQTMAYCMDVPMYGGRSWESMYESGGQSGKLSHISASGAYRIAKTRDTIRRNQALVDAAIGEAFGVIDPEVASDYAILRPDLRPRDAMIARAVAEIPGKLAELEPLKGVGEDVARTIRTLKAAQAALTRYPEIERPLRDQLAQQQRVLADHVKGQTVFLGWAAEGQVDMVPTPLHQRCPGVVIHGAVYNGAMSGELWRRVPYGYTIAITAVFGLLATLLVIWLSPAKGLVSLLGGAVAYAGINGVLLFDYADLIVGLAGPLTVVGTVWAGLMLSRVIAEIRERNRITRRFQSYVDPNLVKYVIEHPELSRLEGEVREMTVVFSDLAGFTTLAEQLKEKAVEILGRYMTRMVPTIRRNNGLIHKFMGDGIMFSFGAPVRNPTHAADAVATVLAMQAELERFNEELVAEGQQPLRMRTGVSTGMVVVGDSGADDASDYTCLGDTTNLGSRLESANKAIGTLNLLSARTVELLNGQYLVSPVGRLVVAGKSQGVMAYTPVAATGAASDAQTRVVESTAAMVEHFVAARFAECVAAADRLDELVGSSKLTALYRELSTRYIADPPAEFWGQIVLGDK